MGRERAIPVGDGTLPAVAIVALQELEETLWAQREALEQLCYRLTTAKLVLAAVEHRFVARATSEADRASRRVTAVVDDVLRLTARAGAALDLPHATLEDLTVACPEPHRSLLADHAMTTARLAHEASTRTDEVRRLVATGTAELAGLAVPITGAEPCGYGADGTTVAPQPRARRFDGGA
jgi:hypothetical protein